jgi:hypothetical protein
MPLLASGLSLETSINKALHPAVVRRGDGPAWWENNVFYRIWLMPGNRPRDMMLGGSIPVCTYVHSPAVLHLTALSR